jgi:nitrogen fixation/metabolism regulation signal transduction histidine kinase
MQLRVALAFVVGGLFSALLGGILQASLWMNAAAELPGDGHELRGGALGLLALGFLLSAVLVAPVLLLLGLAVTFRIVGPLHRFRTFLGRVERGECPPPCRIRQEDELHDLCELLNRATAPLRASDASTAEPERPAA